MALQAHLPVDTFDLNDFQEAVDIELGWYSGDLADGVPWEAERDRANNRCEEIAEVMWVQYQGHLADCHHCGEMDIN